MAQDREATTFRLARPAAARSADEVIIMAIEVRVARVQDLGCLVTGSIRCPAMVANPIEAATVAGNEPPRRARRAATRAVTGMNQGGAIPAPHPTASADGTDSGTVTPNGSPGTLSRTATTLLIAADPA